MFFSFIIKLKLVEFGGNEKIKKYVNFFHFKKLIGEKLKATVVSDFLTKDRFFKERGIYFLRISCISQMEMRTLVRFLHGKKIFKETISIQDKEFTILDIIYDGNKSIYAKQLSIKELLYLEGVEKVEVKFLTPTFFKVGEQFIDEPEPYLYFASVLKYFNKFFDNSELKMESFSKSLLKNIVLESKEIKKKEVYVEGVSYCGFVGKVTYSIPENFEELKKIVDILTEISFFTGVGQFTRLGLGSIIIEKKENKGGVFQ